MRRKLHKFSIELVPRDLLNILLFPFRRGTSGEGATVHLGDPWHWSRVHSAARHPDPFRGQSPFVSPDPGGLIDPS